VIEAVSNHVSEKEPGLPEFTSAQAYVRREGSADTGPINCRQPDKMGYSLAGTLHSAFRAVRPHRDIPVRRYGFGGDLFQ
jgi:hypothetical protein